MTYEQKIFISLVLAAGSAANIGGFAWKGHPGALGFGVFFGLLALLIAIWEPHP